MAMSRDENADTRQSALSQLRHHLLTFASGAKIESTRFRSVPFAAPTTARPIPAGEKSNGRGSKEIGGSVGSNSHGKQRAAAWRAEAGDGEGKDDSKVWLDSKGKRKVAFIKKDVSYYDSRWT